MANKKRYLGSPEQKEYTRKYNAERRKLPEVKAQRAKYGREKLLSHYGLNEGEYKAILDSQGGVCAICERPSKTRSLDVDHEHQSKEKTRSPESRKKRVRGLLCHRCNRALGLFGNDMKLLLLASKNFSEYIEKYYAKRLQDANSDAQPNMENVVTYLEEFEKRKPK